MENKQIITDFYEAFAGHDAGAMTALYHNDIEFSDPAFGLLKGDDAKNMWRMLIARAKGDLLIEFTNVSADDQKGSADWFAKYTFSRTKRPVINKIHAEFEFRDGLIYRHNDTFDFWIWSKQALGVPGILFGWTSFMQQKVQRTALASLKDFSQGSVK